MAFMSFVAKIEEKEKTLFHLESLSADFYSFKLAKSVDCCGVESIFPE